MDSKHVIVGRQTRGIINYMSAIVSIVSCVPQKIWETFLHFSTRKDYTLPPHPRQAGMDIGFALAKGLCVAVTWRSWQSPPCSSFSLCHETREYQLPLHPVSRNTAGANSYKHVKNTVQMVWEIAQWIMHSLSTSDGWSPDLRHPHKCCVGVAAACYPCPLGKVSGEPGES